jgi:CheY-like chemotaxis protein/cytidylate kinase
MSVITLFSGSYCNGEEVARKVVEMSGYALMNEEALIAEASSQFGTDEGKLTKALMGKTSVFNKFTHEKERSLACLKMTLAEILKSRDNLLLRGLSGLMIPADISHVLKVCLIADLKYRISVAADKESISEKDAMKTIHKEDESRVLWVEHLFNQKDPWNPALYDMLIPMDKTSVEEAAALIFTNVKKDVLKVSDKSRLAVEDFNLAAQVEMKLVKEGHYVSVFAKEGEVTLVINKHVLMLSSLEEELKRIVQDVPGVKGVQTKVGSGYYQTDIYRKFDFDVPLPSKVLVVDDEREFAQTLSERLQMRSMGAAAVYDGAEALSMVDEEEPEVMVLDLKMPGVDGLEVLRRVKAEHPNVEVIVLTGHGSKEIEKECLAMGACAYLEKPVDMDTLTRTMKEAYAKIRERENLKD